MHKGRVIFGAMDEVVFGHPAVEAIVAQIDRLHSSRAFLMVSGTYDCQFVFVVNDAAVLNAEATNPFASTPGSRCGFSGK